MAATDNASPPPRLPISVLTGFLGSGKTTLLSRLIREPAMAGTAVVINEFGEVGLDHLLVAKADETTVLMDSGCLCCTIRSDLADTLRDLYLKRLRGEVPAFDRVVVETTGLADPAPILHTLMTDPLILARFRLDGVVTTVDAVHGSGQLDRHPESRKQAAVADRLVLTKTDIADPAAVILLKARLRALNPAATLIEAASADALAALLFGAGLYDPQTKTLDVRRWLKAEAYADAHHHPHDHDHHHGHAHDVNRHGDGIAAFCLELDGPLPGEAVVGFFDTLAAAYGERVLRVKGLLHLEGTDRPVVIHGVQHLFHPPAELPAWPSPDRTSRIVFILDGLERRTVADLLAAHLPHRLRGRQA